MADATGKEFAASASGTTGNWENCQPAISAKNPKPVMTGALQTLLKTEKEM